MAAAAKGNSQVVRLLLEAGANRGFRDNAGDTAHDWAIQMKKDEVVAVLREHERLELVVRPEVAACSGRALPCELAELCGDYVVVTPGRRALEARTRAKQ